MVTQDLLNYVRSELSAGKNRGDVTLDLVTSGWAGEDIDEVFRQAGNGLPPNPSNPPPGKLDGRLPSVINLFKESWQLFKVILLPFLRLIGLGIVGFAAVGLIIGAIVFILTVFKVNPFSLTSIAASTGVFETILIIVTILLTIVGLIYLIAVISPMIQISIIMILSSGGNLPVLQAIKNSRVLAIPFFLTTAFSGLVMAGGIYALLIPGIYFSVIFAFVQYIVVVDGLKGKEALKRNYMMVKGRFWPVFFRFIAISIISYALSFVLQLVADDNSFLVILLTIFNIFVNLFTAAYCFVLFQKVKQLPLYPRPVSMKWIWVTSILGFVMFPLLLAFMLIAINPSRQFAQANDTQRKSDVNVILNAISQYQAESSGILPLELTSDRTISKISKTGVDICSLLVPNYVQALPSDPKVQDGDPIEDCESSYDTGYTIEIVNRGSTNPTITISAPNAELNEKISVSR